MKSKKKLLRISILTTLIIIFIWWIVTALNVVPQILLPSPQRVIRAFFNLISFGYNGISLERHYLITIGRLFVAVIIAIIVGIPAGLLSGYVEKFGAVIDPIIQFIRPIPPLAYYTLLILWFGIGEFSKVTLLFFAALPPIYIASYDAVHRINREYIQSAASLGATKKTIIFQDYFTSINARHIYWS